MKKHLFLFLFFCSLPLLAQNSVRLQSPNKALQFDFTLDERQPSYSISFKKQLLIDRSALGFEFDNGLWMSGLKMNKPLFRTGKETYNLLVGKASTVHSHYKEVIISLEEKAGLKRKVNLIVRAFDDGIAFRYEFPQQSAWKSYVMYDEKTAFNIKGNPASTVLCLPSYTSSHEGLYTKANYQELKSNQLMDMPALFQYPEGIYLSITEAAVRDYAGMYLMKEGNGMIGKLSPSLKDERVKVVAELPHQSPWRVCMISDRVGALIESNILTNLNEPCKIEDTSWLKPGKTTFTWWNGNVVPDTSFMAGNNFMTNKYYIDFAARNKLEYHSIYGYAEQPWYTDDGFDFGAPGKNVDITKPIAPLNMKYICDYAKSQGVDIHVWTNWKALYAKIDEAFPLFEQWGIKGMMIDFMDRDDQEMIRIQEEFLVKAARHHLFVQFHGSSKPSGLHRTYPNEFTREGTYNYEIYKWGSDINADHDISMPFTRLLAGPADYHLGGFRSVPHDQHWAQFANPRVSSTRCHMLAMYVVLESYLAMVCDTPEAYEGQSGFEFLQAVPTVWDATVVPEASVNEYVTIARKKDNEWFVGTINNSTPRTLDIPLDFLGEGNYMATIYLDAPDSDIHPNKLVKKTQAVTFRDKLTVKLAKDGGCVFQISPIK
ncbi:alpha-glucosidase [Parabacteroides sp. PF5-5]|uniref:glycoside hydrolase family 97 protein n=1 Tax=unclassified Parabacteroides TaxID=2649774 RepID=UPI0024750D03|nr:MULTISPECIES: glycoside hydrolase family 97 protein [unclassified Parabacteroides]MDH6305436.1 alpha-glucosidase [Parabacteroides sp. PH5-39]MDH6316146.1 alpha-glucosidase [Parabacteroides sp. PF5-13]MDH6320296.1 alpha-glucosidase [Parabacteroides sp. PH5-13]MDH6324026.1 alpha-glucosidase [Parabacteroides sp. PH5-8]MDH6327337.1 alpha-glucosidase [Parabacteroides sp. PH5-41]